MTSAALAQRSEPCSDEDVARAIALLSEGLLTSSEFQALTGMSAASVPQFLADQESLAAVQRSCLQLRNSGSIARLEALRHAREAVETAARIMRDSEMHASTRLNAATFIAKVSGTERPAEERKGTSDRFVLTINLGDDRPPVVVDGAILPIEQRLE